MPYIEGESAGPWDNLIGKTVISAKYMHSSGQIVLEFDDGSTVWVSMFSRAMLASKS